MAELIETICREADEEARSRFGPRFFTRYRGQLRYFRVEDDFQGLGAKFPELAVQLELHLGNTASFAAINRPDLRLTLAHLENYTDNPFARPFRRGNLTQAQSKKFVPGPALFNFEPPNPKRLVAALCFGFAKDAPNVPLYTEVRFADAEWQCLGQYRDIRLMLLDSRQVPVEEVADARDTTTRVPTERVASETVADQRYTRSRSQNVQRRDA